MTNDFPPKVGGIQSYLWELWQRLDPSSTTVLTARSHRDHASFDHEQLARGLRIVRVRGRILFFPTPFALRRIRRACAETQPDLVLLDPVWPLGLLGPRIGIPYGCLLYTSSGPVWSSRTVGSSFAVACSVVASSTFGCSGSSTRTAISGPSSA